MLIKSSISETLIVGESDCSKFLALASAVEYFLKVILWTLVRKDVFLRMVFLRKVV
jgi:hypothetical protein